MASAYDRALRFQQRFRRDVRRVGLNDAYRRLVFEPPADDDDKESERADEAVREATETPPNILTLMGLPFTAERLKDVRRRIAPWPPIVHGLSGDSKHHICRGECFSTIEFPLDDHVVSVTLDSQQAELIDYNVALTRLACDITETDEQMTKFIEEILHNTSGTLSPYQSDFAATFNVAVDEADGRHVLDYYVWLIFLTRLFADDPLYERLRLTRSEEVTPFKCADNLAVYRRLRREASRDAFVATKA